MELMEQIIRAALAATQAEKETMCGMMALEFVSCEESGPTLTLALNAKPWMTNPLGVMHGGLVTSAMDTTMGTLSFYATEGKRRTPTVSMETAYIRPVPLSGRILIRARLTSAGRTLVYLTSELCAEDAPERILATSSGVYFRTEK